jgi:hypothetical protein
MSPAYTELKSCYLCKQRILPSFVVPGLLGAASDPASLNSGGGALPVTLFDEVLVYLLNRLSEHLLEFQQSPQAASLQHALDATVSCHTRALVCAEKCSHP